MSSFKIVIDGLEQLKKAYSADAVNAKVIPDVSIAVLKFNNLLDERVQKVFNVGESIDSVRIGSKVAPEQVGKSLLRYSLQYRDKPIPLAKYPFSITDSTAISKAPLRKKSGHVVWTEGQWSKEVRVEVRKGKSLIAKRGKSYRLKGFFTGTNIKAREQKATWDIYPSKDVLGKRAPYSTLFGPSLATLVSTVYEKDNVVKNGVDVLTDDILKAFVKSYT